MARNPHTTLPRQAFEGPLRAVFFGTPALAVPTLDALVAAPELARVVAVVAQPDRPAGRGLKLNPPPVARRARDLGLPLLQPEKIRSGDFPIEFEYLQADVGVVVAYGRVLATRILEAPRFGCVNVHASLLPKYRGAGPIQRAIMDGEAETGVTTMWMEEGLDTGPILLRRTLPIRPDDDAKSLGERLAGLGAALLVETLRALLAGTLEARPQQEEGASLAPLLEREDGRIRWDLEAAVIERRIRGVTPWPGAFCDWAGGELKVLAAERAEGADGAERLAVPGTILATDERGIVVACGRGALRLTQVQAPGRKPMRAAEFLRGHDLAPGQRLGGAGG
jgi:methionyl-tRNA formyltransferase